jgi:hypothetical protein
MTKEFIPYEQALALKELGFDEPCFGYYGVENEFVLDNMKNTSPNYSRRGFTSAPLYSQAFRWFREKYDLREQYGAFPHHTIMMNYIIEGGREDESELECLKKLIELIKQKQL